MVLLAALLLAGCASEAPKPAATKAPEPVVITSLDDASSLANATFMNESHQHDYWGGKTQLTLMDLDTQVGSTIIGGEVVFWFRPDPGHVVPQGTDKLTVSMAWSEDVPTQHASPELWVRAPRDHDPRKVSAIENGKPIDITTTLADADVPHQQLSAWRFELRFHPATVPQYVEFRGRVHIVVLAHRGLDIPVLPPHPDVWNGRESITLFDDTAKPSVWEGAPPDSSNCYSGGCPEVHRAANGTVVPYDAKAVELRLTEDGTSAGTLTVRYHAADTWNWTKLTPTRVDGATKVFVIPVAGLTGDGPYAAQSLWEFAPYVSSPTEGGQHAGGYHLTARALRSL